MTTLVVALTLASGAQAREGDLFTPTTTIDLSTTRAGVATELTTTISQPQTGCPDREPLANICTNEEFDTRQSLKRVVLSMPPGFFIDANANRHYCDPYQRWDRRTSYQFWVWECEDPASKVGEVWISSALCVPIPGFPQWDDYWGCTRLPIYDPGMALAASATVYNDRPRAGEQGHLVVFWPGNGTHRNVDDLALTRFDMSVRVRESDLGITSTVDNAPDLVSFIRRDRRCGFELDEGDPLCSVITRTDAGGQPSDVVLRLDGNIGRENGHPLVSNSTSCGRQSFRFELQGYARNSVEPPSDLTSEDPEAIEPASGEGHADGGSHSYEAVGCEEVPYAPQLDLGLEKTAPDRATGVEATVTQPYPASEEFVDEQTSKGNETIFPAAFKINPKNTATHCTEGQLRARECPESSKIGTVKAKSRLLQLGQEFSGDVFLTGIRGDYVSMTALLKGSVVKGTDPITVRIDARGQRLNDGRLRMRFDDLPEVPINEFKLKVEGGSKAIMKTPKVCGTYTIVSRFASHAGKVVETKHPVTIEGCGDPAFDAELSSKRVGGLTNLDLSLAGPASGTHAIKSAQFGIAGLRWRVPTPAKTAKSKNVKARRGVSAGRIILTTSSGTAAEALRIEKTGDGARFVPSTSQGLGALGVPDFTAQLTKPRKARKKKQKASPKSALALNGLPGNDLTDIELSLRGRSRSGPRIRLPRAKRGAVIRFTAAVTLVDGRQLILTDREFVKGATRAAHRKKKRKARRRR